MKTQIKLTITSLSTLLPGAFALASTAACADFDTHPEPDFGLSSAGDDGLGETGDGADETGGSEEAEAGLDESETGCDLPCGEECCGADEQCDPDALECVLDCGAEVEPCGLDNPVCCGDGQVCYVGECIEPGAACSLPTCATEIEVSECGSDEICDPSFGFCVPDLANEACTFTPPKGFFDPTPRWTWGVRKDRSCGLDDDCQTGEVCTEDWKCEPTWTHVTPAANDYPTAVQVHSTPLVADLDGDCVPEVVFNSYLENGDLGHGPGVLRVVRGDTGEKVWSLGTQEWVSQSASVPAIGDLDDDGDLEIVNVAFDGRLMAIDHLGQPIWKTAEAQPNPYWYGAPSLANIDLQSDVEIIYGDTIYDSSGTKVWTGVGGKGSNGDFGMFTCVADVDGDSRPELVAGGTVHSFTGTIGVDFDSDLLWVANDGYCGIADFDLDGLADVALVSEGIISVRRGATGEVLGQFAIPGGGDGGAPNIADFDGDGIPDIGTAGATRYVVVRFADGGLSKLWEATVDDSSSHRTGSSVFDFDGDGRSEVVYADEHFLRIYPGTEQQCATNPPGPACDGVMTDWEVLFKELNTSHTLGEYPVIADVDGDYKSEIVLATNNAGVWADEGDSGLTMLEDRADNWVATRPIWNQHTYHVTNVEVDGSIPTIEQGNWMTPIDAPINSYRNNSQAEVQNCAPDLIATDLELEGICDDSPTFTARVCNQGCLGVGPGVEVKFAESEAGQLGIITTDESIPAGGCIEVELDVALDGAPWQISVSVDDDGQADGELNECDEANNTLGPVEMCVPVG